jgi:hypothetical protein
MGNWGAAMNDKTRLDPLLLTIPDAARLIALHRDTVWEMTGNVVRNVFRVRGDTPLQGYVSF